MKKLKRLFRKSNFETMFLRLGLTALAIILFTALCELHANIPDSGYVYIPCAVIVFISLLFWLNLTKPKSYYK